MNQSPSLSKAKLGELSALLWHERFRVLGRTAGARPSLPASWTAAETPN
jgi:hypothetical protein